MLGVFGQPLDMEQHTSCTRRRDRTLRVRDRRRVVSDEQQTDPRHRQVMSADRVRHHLRDLAQQVRTERAAYARTQLRVCRQLVWLVRVGERRH